MKITETQVVFQCMDLLGVYGIYAWRNNTGALKDKKGRLVRYGLPGSSDIIGITRDGRFLAVECKRPDGGIVSELQKTFIEKVNRMNGIGCIVRSAEELKDCLIKAGVISGTTAAGV